MQYSFFYILTPSIDTLFKDNRSLHFHHQNQRFHRSARIVKGVKDGDGSCLPRWHHPRPFEGVEVVSHPSSNPHSLWKRLYVSGKDCGFWTVQSQDLRYKATSGQCISLFQHLIPIKCWLAAENGSAHSPKRTCIFFYLLQSYLCGLPILGNVPTLFLLKGNLRHTTSRI